eukprot:scaffold30636_cov129-Isochrysis_galbana.AAC.2
MPSSRLGRRQRCDVCCVFIENYIRQCKNLHVCGHPSPAPLEDPLYLFRRRATGLLDIRDPGPLPDPDECRLAPGMPS